MSQVPPKKNGLLVACLTAFLIVGILTQIACLLRALRGPNSGPLGLTTVNQPQDQASPPPPPPEGFAGVRGTLPTGGSPGDRSTRPPGGSPGDRSTLPPGGSPGDRSTLPPGGSPGDRSTLPPGGSPSGRGTFPPAPGSAPVGAPPGSASGVRGFTPQLRFEDFAAVVVLLDESSAPLSASQRAEALVVVRTYTESATRMATACRAIYSVLSGDQRQRFLSAPTSSSGAPPPDVNALTDTLITTLEQQAARRGAQSAPDAAAPRPPTERFAVLSGLYNLASNKALSAEQARTALDGVKVMRDEMTRQNALEQKLGTLLTPPQLQLLSQDTPRDSVTAWLLARYLERGAK